MGNANPGGNCVFSAVSPIPCDPASNPRELLVGDSDWDWADRNEVRVDRIVGTISWRVADAYESFNVGYPQPWVVRFGILATEETDRLYQAIDLFDRESLEEFQWMYLHQSMGTTETFLVADGIYNIQYEDLHIDVRTRRALGKKDSVVLYAQAKRHTDSPPGVTITSLQAQYVESLRCIIRA